MAIVEKYERIGVNGRRTVTWRVRYRDPSGRQRARTFRRKADADDYAASVHMDVRRGEWVDPQHGRTPYGDWLEPWLRTTPDRRPSTCARNESLLANHVLPRFRLAARSHHTDGGPRLGRNTIRIGPRTRRRP